MHTIEQRKAKNDLYLDLEQRIVAAKRLKKLAQADDWYSYFKNIQEKGVHIDKWFLELEEENRILKEDNLNLKSELSQVKHLARGKK